ncbi:MAG: hypothetical protein KA110_11570 [Acidimicrobiia bacterium]|nr:hypothetical protein [Acidimicrobiia bacterium]
MSRSVNDEAAVRDFPTADMYQRRSGSQLNDRNLVHRLRYLSRMIVAVLLISGLAACDDSNDNGVIDSPYGEWTSAFCSEMLASSDAESIVADEAVRLDAQLVESGLEKADSSGGQPPERAAGTIADVRRAVDSNTLETVLADGSFASQTHQLLALCMAVTPELIEASPRFIVDPMPAGYSVCSVFDTLAFSNAGPDETRSEGFWFDVTLWSDTPEDPLAGIAAQVNSPAGTAVHASQGVQGAIKVSKGIAPGTFEAVVTYPALVEADEMRPEDTHGADDSGNSETGTPNQAAENNARASTASSEAHNESEEPELIDFDVRITTLGATESEAREIAESLEFNDQRFQLTAPSLERVYDSLDQFTSVFPWWLNVTDGATTVWLSPSASSVEDMSMLDEFSRLTSGGEIESSKPTTLGGNRALISAQDGSAFVDIGGATVAISDIGFGRAPEPMIRQVAERLRPVTADEWNDLLWEPSDCPAGV